jgi:predicted enzyme related to lactoylglutathione lyase
MAAATVLIYVAVEDVDAVCEQARAAGVEILEEPAAGPGLIRGAGRTGGRIE